MGPDSVDLESFGWSIGISDILGWRECPQRFVFGMRRHTPMPERMQLTPGERDEPPESTNWTNAYGSAIHHAIHLVDTKGYSHSMAVASVMTEYGPWLTPEDVALLYEDLKVFESRRPLGVTLVASEQDVKVPLFIADNGQQIYFRFKLDVLYKLIVNPSVFLHRDYKSSKWVKTQSEVHKDPQMWSYNWGIHDLYPECGRLLQTYDQLKFGELDTSKNDKQRDVVKLWLIENVKAIMADDVYKPKQNDFCRYCPMVVTCRETKRSTDFWKGKLALEAPLIREGRKTRIELAEEGDEIERLIEVELPRMIQARKHLEKVEEMLKEIIRNMPPDDVARLGWKLQRSTRRRLPAEGLREIHAMLGDVFYELIGMSQTTIDEFFGKPKKGEPVAPELEIVRNWMLTDEKEPQVVPAKRET